MKKMKAVEKEKAEAVASISSDGVKAYEKFIGKCVQEQNASNVKFDTRTYASMESGLLATLLDQGEDPQDIMDYLNFRKDQLKAGIEKALIRAGHEDMGSYLTSHAFELSVISGKYIPVKYVSPLKQRGYTHGAQVRIGDVVFEVTKVKASILTLKILTIIKEDSANG